MSDGQVEYIPFEDPRLGRHIRHDPDNRRFAAPRGEAPTQDKRHRVYGKRLDQFNVGACTGFTGAHALNALPKRRDVAPKRTMTNADALAFYSGATGRDPWEGIYPPTDTGSSGLAVALELRDRGLITGFEWAFGFQHGLDVIDEKPLMQGTWWTDDMFHPDADGRVHPRGSDAGGHEYLWQGVEIRSKLNPSQNRSWFLNSWGVWGENGYFYMTWSDHEALLARDGDLISLV